MQVHHIDLVDDQTDFGLKTLRAGFSRLHMLIRQSLQG